MDKWMKGSLFWRPENCVLTLVRMGGCLTFIKFSCIWHLLWHDIPKFTFIRLLLNSYKLAEIISCHPILLLRRYSDSLRAGRSGNRIPVGARFSVPFRPDPASCTMGTGPFPGIKRPELGAELRMGKSYIPPPPLCACIGMSWGDLNGISFLRPDTM
jgi:hypothetical protein